MSVKKSLAFLFAALALVVLAEIYRFSAQPKNVSREKSDEVAVVVENINQNIESKKQQNNIADSENKTDEVINENPQVNKNSEKSEKEESKPSINFNKLVRKGAHVAEYAAFAFCFSMFFVLIDKTRSTYLIVLAVGAAYALFDEAHQFFIPGRTPKLKDILFDMIGLVLGTAFAYIISAIIKARKSKRKTV